MGMLGEHYAMSLYRGSEGIHGFLDLQADGALCGPGGPDPGSPNSRRRSRTANNWTRDDREVIKELGLKVPGTKRLAVVPQLPSILLPVVPGGRERLRFLSCRAGAVGGRGPTL